MSKSAHNLSFQEKLQKQQKNRSFLSETRLSFNGDDFMCNPNLENQEIDQYQESNYKYITTICYFFTALICCLGQGTFVPITPIVMNLYNLSRQQVTMSMLVIFIIMPIATFPANYILDKFGLKIGITFGVVLLTSGMFIRTFIDQSWYYVIIGQGIIGMGIPFIQNCPSKVSAAWFNFVNRQSITLLFTFSILMSAPLGFVMPSIYINQLSSQEDVRKLIFHQFYITGAICVMNILFFKGKPKVAPSLSMTVKKEQFWVSLKKLIKNKSYIFVFLSASLFLGSINGFIPNLALWLAPFGFGENDCSVFTIAMLIFGIIGSIISSYYLKKNQQYKKMIIICLVLGITLFVTAYFTLYFQSTIVTSIFIAFSGFFLFPVVSIQIEMATEVSFPVGEAMATGILFSGGQLFGFVTGIISTSVIDGQSKESSLYGLIIVIFIIIVSSVFMGLSKNNLMRSKVDSSGSLQILNEEQQNALQKSLIQNNDDKIIINDKIDNYTDLTQKEINCEDQVLEYEQQQIQKNQFIQQQNENQDQQNFKIQNKDSEINIIISNQNLQ